MKKSMIFTLILILGFSLPSMAMRRLSLESTVFSSSSFIPLDFTCKGQDSSPPLEWQDSSSDTQSYVLIVEDQDAPNGVWDHWVLFNIPPDLRHLPANAPIPPNATSGLNSWGGLGYRGPCPHEGIHRYIFRLYALNIMLNIKNTPTKNEVLDAMQGHVLAIGELIGRFKA